MVCLSSADFSDCCCVCTEKKDVKKCSACKMVSGRDIYKPPLEESFGLVLFHFCCVFLVASMKQWLASPLAGIPCQRLAGPPSQWITSLCLFRLVIVASVVKSSTGKHTRSFARSWRKITRSNLSLSLRQKNFKKWIKLKKINRLRLMVKINACF